MAPLKKAKKAAAQAVQAKKAAAPPAGDGAAAVERPPAVSVVVAQLPPPPLPGAVAVPFEEKTWAAMRQPDDGPDVKFPSFPGAKLRVQFESRTRAGEPVSRLVWRCEDKFQVKVNDF